MNLKTVIFGRRANPVADLLSDGDTRDGIRYPDDVVYHVYKDSPAYEHAVLYGAAYKILKK